MREARVTDGLRGTIEVAREVSSQFPSHMPEAHGKIVFVCDKRGAGIELRPEKKVVVNGEVVVTPQVFVKFEDGIVTLDPGNEDDALKIKLIMASEFFAAPGRSVSGILRIRDRKDVIEERELERAQIHLQEHAKIMADPRMAAKLRQLAGKQGFGLKESGEAADTPPPA